MLSQDTYTEQSSHPAIDQAGANVINHLADYGGTVIILCIALGFAVFANVLQFKRNNSLVDQMFNIIPQTTAAVMQAVHDFKEAVDELLKKD